MMRFPCKWLVLLWMALPLALSGAVPASTNSVAQAGDLLRQASLRIIDAELARSEQHQEEAAADYRSALEILGRIQADYPGWQAVLVNYRVADCQNALAVLERAAPLEVANASSNAEARLQSLLTDLRDVRGVLATLPEPPSVAAQKQLARDRDRLQSQLDEQVRNNQALERKLAKSEARLKKAGIRTMTNGVSVVATTVRQEASRLLDENKAGEALALLREAVDVIPSDSGLLFALGAAQCRAGRYAESLATLQPLVGREAVGADALVIAGSCYMALGEIGSARVAMERAVKLDPASAVAHYNLAQILLSLLPPDVEDAQAEYLRALELGLKPDPDFENTLRMNLVISKVKKHNASTKSVTSSRSPSTAVPVPVR